MFGYGLVHGLVDGQEGLAGAPVHLAHELATKGVDDTGDGGRLALADKVKVEHALDSSRLQTAVVVQGQRSISIPRAPIATLTIQSIASLGGRGYARQAGSMAGLEPGNDECCRLRRGGRWRWHWPADWACYSKLVRRKALWADERRSKEGVRFIRLPRVSGSENRD